MRLTTKILLALSLILNVVFITLVFAAFNLPSIIELKKNTEDFLSKETQNKNLQPVDASPILTLDSVNTLLNQLNVTNFISKTELMVATIPSVKKRSKKAVEQPSRTEIKPLSEYSVALYPTKAASEINLNLSGYANQSFGVFIISKRGKVEAYYEFKGNSVSERRMSLDISGLDNGTYFAHLVSKGDRVIKKFVKV